LIELKKKKKKKKREGGEERGKGRWEKFGKSEN